MPEGRKDGRREERRRSERWKEEGRGRLRRRISLEDFAFEEGMKGREV